MGYPIFKKDDGWHFYDETFSRSFGPFDSDEIAEKACTRYAEMVLEGRHDPYPEIADVCSKLQWD